MLFRSHLVREALEGAGLPCALMPPHLLYQTAWGVARCALRMAQAGELVSAAAMAPSYHRLSQAERERLSAQKRGEADSEGAWSGARAKAQDHAVGGVLSETEGKRTSALAASQRDSTEVRRSGQRVSLEQ